MVISVALGTSTPTSTTDVETSTWISPLRKSSITASFSAARHAAVDQPEAEIGQLAVGQRLEGRFQADGGHLVRFLDQRRDDVALPAFAEFFAEEVPPLDRACRRRPDRCCTFCRPGGLSRSVETSRSPNSVMVTVRGMGVAVITR